jgi:hypothetical protein
VRISFDALKNLKEQRVSPQQNQAAVVELLALASKPVSVQQKYGKPQHCTVYINLSVNTIPHRLHGVQCVSSSHSVSRTAVLLQAQRDTDCWKRLPIADIKALMYCVFGKSNRSSYTGAPPKARTFIGWRMSDELSIDKVL